MPFDAGGGNQTPSPEHKIQTALFFNVQNKAIVAGSVTGSTSMPFARRMMAAPPPSPLLQSLALFRSFSPACLSKPPLYPSLSLLLNALRRYFSFCENDQLAFFTHVSHEFRTPLSVVIGYTEDVSDLKGRPTVW